MEMDSSTSRNQDIVPREERVSEWHPMNYLEPKSVPALSYALLILNQPIGRRHFSRYWEGASFTICADGGANRLYDLCEASKSHTLENYIPKVIHGDLDSLLPKVEEYYRGHGCEIVQDTDQETTDFTKCLRLVNAKAVDIVTSPHRKLDVVVLGGLGGRVDHGLSQLHHLYMASQDTSLRIGQIVLLTSESITFLLHKGHNKIYTPLGKGFLAENVGIVPVGRPAVISTKGLEWDVSNWETEFGGQISTSNHIKSDIVEIQTTERVVFTIELAHPY